MARSSVQDQLIIANNPFQTSSVPPSTESPVAMDTGTSTDTITSKAFSQSDIQSERGGPLNDLDIKV